MVSASGGSGGGDGGGGGGGGGAAQYGSLLTSDDEGEGEVGAEGGAPLPAPRDASLCDACRALSAVESCDVFGLALLFTPPLLLSLFVIIAGFVNDDTWIVKTLDTGVPVSLVVDVPALLFGIVLWALMLKLPWEKWSLGLRRRSPVWARCCLACAPDIDTPAARRRSMSGEWAEGSSAAEQRRLRW